MVSVKSKGKEIGGTLFGALRYKGFRYFWLGQCVSLIGTWMQRTALVWLVYTITDSPFLVGLLGVCQFLPMFLFSLVSGVVVDRFPKKKILIATQFLFMLQAFTLAWLTFSGHAKYPYLLVLSILFGLLQTFDMPARQAFFQELVGRDRLMNAISLNSTIANLARIVGPAVSGLAMASLGTAMCFLINGFSFFAVLTSLFLIHPMKIDKPAVKMRHITRDIKEGIKYIGANNDLRWNCLFAAIACTFLMNNDVIIPVFAKEVLGGDAHTYTFLLSAAGIGALCGSLFMSMRADKGLSRKLLFKSLSFVMLMQLLLFFVSNFYIAFGVIVAMSFANLSFLNMSNSMFQLDSDTAHRGRVMSVYSFLNQGSTPIGNFCAGSMMERMGGVWGFGGGGLITLFFLFGVMVFKGKSFLRWYSGS